MNGGEWRLMTWEGGVLEQVVSIVLEVSQHWVSLSSASK